MEPAEHLSAPDWLDEPATRAVVAALTARGAEVRLVGGCVRDSLAGRPIKDIDLATPETPERVMALLEDAGLKAVPTGLAHGTVTAVSHGIPYQITTLRRDLKSDGRHAAVAFTDDWQADAARRDFTFNALSLSPDGRLYDPYGGRADLAAGRVRFVGDPARRIAEDRLRLLRFFRFHAHYGQGAPDLEGLAAAVAAAPGLAALSGERIREELLRLLAAADPAPILAEMIAGGVLRAVLPEIAGTDALAALVALDRHRDRDSEPLRRLAALLPATEGLGPAVADRLRLSRRDRDRLTAMLAEPAAFEGTPPFEPGALRRTLYRQGAPLVLDLLLLTWARKRWATGPDLDQALAVLQAWDAPRFPLTGQDLRARGLAEGSGLGDLLRDLEDWWIAADFQPDRAACLARLDARLAGAGA